MNSNTVLSKGYKFISEIGSRNWDIYIDKAEKNEVVYFTELENRRGYFDDEEISGIYFCKSQKELIPWVQDCIDWENPDAIEILEVKPLDEITVRKYNNGRVAYVVNSCYVRVLNDKEIDSELLKIIYNHFS